MKRAFAVFSMGSLVFAALTSFAIQRAFAAEGVPTKYEPTAMSLEQLLDADYTIRSTIAEKGGLGIVLADNIGSKFVFCQLRITPAKAGKSAASSCHKLN